MAEATFLLEVFQSYPWWSWLFAMVTVLAATCVQYSLGIAFGLVAGPLLALNQVDFVPLPVLLLTAVTAISGAWRERQRILWHDAKWSISGRLVGGLFAVSILAFIPDEKTFLLVFGLLIGLAVLLSVSGLKFAFNRKTLSLAGIVSGFTATITGVGGPPMALIYQHQKSSEARPTLQLFFAVGALISAVLLLASGAVGVRQIAITALLLPGFVGGQILGKFVQPYFDKNFRIYLLALAGASSILLIWRGLS